MNKIDKKYKESFDIIFLLEVLEYIWNPVQCFKNINQLLKVGGICYLSVHFIYPVHNPPELDYLRYTPKGAIKLLEEAGFEIVEMKPRELVVWTDWDTLVDDERMRPAREYNMHNWQGCLITARKI